MAIKWIRELMTGLTGDGSGTPFAIKALSLFLTNVLGYTVLAEAHPGGAGNGSWTSAGGGNWNFTALTNGDFSASDVGGIINIAGSTPQNNGSWTIVSVSSRTTLVYNNPTPGATAGTGTWTITDPGSYASTEKNGSNGSFTGSSKNFVDSVAGAFAAGDVGKWLLVAGSARNAGFYKVTAFVSVNEVTIDFRSAATEYPDSAAGLSWWLLSGSYQVPERTGAYIQLQTPHAYGWAVELRYDNLSYHQVRVRVAVDGSFAGRVIGPVYIGNANAKTCWYYCAADSDGSSFSFMVHQATDNRYNGVIVSNIIPYDIGHSQYELVALMGNVGSGVADADNGNLNHNYDTKRVGHGYIWKDWAATRRDVYMVQSTYGGFANGLEKWSSREKNRRRSGSGSGTGDSFSLAGTTITLTDAGAAWVLSDVGKTIKITGATTLGNNGLFVITARLSATQVTYENASGATEAFAGIWAIADFQDMVSGTCIVLDVDNANGEFEFLGCLKGHYGVRSTLGVRTAFSEASPHALDKFHMTDGFGFDWPNLTQQY